METRKVVLDLNYTKEVVNEKKKIYRGGVERPKFINELSIDVFEDYNFNDTTDEFEPNGKYNIEIKGNNRALFELGKFLINISYYETTDPNFHIHIDGILDSSRNECFNLRFGKTEQED